MGFPIYIVFVLKKTYGIIMTTLLNVSCGLDCKPRIQWRWQLMEPGFRIKYNYGTPGSRNRRTHRPLIRRE